jgi:predicted cobalt transporter CbtA
MNVEESWENRPLYKRTLLTVGAMLAASVGFVGVLTLLTVFIVGRAVGEPSSARSGASDAESSKVDTVPGTGVHPEPKVAPKGAPLRPVQMMKSSTAI